MDCFGHERRCRTGAIEAGTAARDCAFRREHAGLDRLWQPRSGQSTSAIGPNRAVILKEQITISA
jgi:hypothetical protein